MPFTAVKKVRHHSHLELRNTNVWLKKAATAHPNDSQLSGAPGRLINAAIANTVATIGAKKEVASARSITIPAPGMILISNVEKRIERNSSQMAIQIATQENDTVRNQSFGISQV
jgi:hypothetical protein